MAKTVQMDPEQAAQAHAQLANATGNAPGVQPTPPTSLETPAAHAAGNTAPPEAPPPAPSAPQQSKPDPASGNGEPLNAAGHLLSELVDEGIRRGLHTAQAFIDRFPPDGIMAELSDEPALRAKILVATLHLPQHTAEMLPPNVAGATLTTALSAGDATPEAILQNFAPDDRVRQLPWAALWAFVTEGEWMRKNDDAAKGFTLYILERAKSHELQDPSAWRDGITIPKLASMLPRELLEKLFERASVLGVTGKAFTGAEMFALLEPKDIVEAFEPGYLFDHVILPLARKCHFLVEGGTIPPTKITQTDLKAAAPETTPKGPAKTEAGKGKKKKSAG